MTAIDNLHNRIDLVNIPYTDRGSRLLMFRAEDQLFFRLAERWTQWEAEVGHYRKRRPLIERFTFLGGDGAPLRLKSDTFPHLISLHTSIGSFDWTFLDPETLLVRLPSGHFTIEFEVQAQQSQTDRRGGTFHGRRNVAYTTNARLLENEITPLDDGRCRARVTLEVDSADVLLLNVTPGLAYNRAIPTADGTISASLARWKAWFNAIPPVLDVYRKQYDYAWWIMGAGLLNSRGFFTREALVPSKIHYVGVWHWDQFFHAIAYRHVDTRLAEDQLRIVLDHQRDDGMLPDAIHDEGIVNHLSSPVDADVTKPPLIAWSALKIYETTGNIDFLKEIYEPVSRWHDWWLNHNMNDLGLCEYQHPFSSGLDDSPLWDDGMPVVAPDLNTYLCIQAESLARIAELIGEHNDASKFRQNAEAWSARMLDVMWNEKLGLFDALYKSKRVPVLTPFSLLPMWTGRLPSGVIERLLRHLTDPTTFWSKWPLPTVAISDPKFNPEQMWRGPTWCNINYLFVEALERIGQHDLAQQLRRKTLDLIMHHDDIYEYYNPLTAGHPPKAAPLFGWTSAVFIDLAIQETRLVTSDVPDKTQRKDNQLT